MITKVNAIVKKESRVTIVSTEFLLYLLPISILLGTNFPAFSVSNRTIYIGTNEVLIAILGIGLLLRILLSKEKLSISRKISRSIFIFSSIAIISILVNILRTQDINHLNSYIEIARWAEYVLVFFIICIFIKTKQQIKNILIIMHLCAILNITFSLYQAATFNYNESRIYGLFISGSNRVGQSVSNPNVLGAFFMINNLYLIAFTMICSLKFRWILWILVTINIIALFQTLSRSAMLGFLVGMLILSYFNRKPSLIMAIAGLAIPILFLSKSLKQRLIESLNLYNSSVAARSILTRFQVWKTTLKQLPNHLFLGVGFGAFQENFGFLTPDNYYLEILATTGFLGLCALVFMFWRIIVAITASEDINDRYFDILRKSYISSIFAFLISNVFGGLLFNPRLLGLFWLLTGLTLKGKYIDQRCAYD
jgi:O-antigen ligase